MANFPCFLSLAIVLTILFSSPPVMSTSRGQLLNRQTGIRVSMTHVDSTSNFTKFERVQRAIKRGNNRLTYLNALVSSDITSLVYPGHGEFLMKLSIGTPPMEFSAIMDTGSDLIWTQCMPCKNCFHQSTPIFDPTNSSSFSKLPCSSTLCGELSGWSECGSDGCEYTYAYGDYSTTEGIMATETFTFGNVSVAKLGFGCGDNNQGSGFSQGAGLVGLGRGPLSLLSQLGESTFSYCLTSIDTAQTSTLSVGSSFASKAMSGSNNYKTTPLNNNPSQPSFYYLNLQGITVGNTSLPIKESSFGIRHDGSGGMIIDSGTTITYLENSVFEVVKDEFINQLVNLKVDESGLSGLDLCFEMPRGVGVSFMEVPRLVFHFEDADLEIPGENYMLEDSGLGLMCLIMAGSSEMSIFGNLMQQNMLVVHDLSKETVSFIPTQCDQLM